MATNKLQWKRIAMGDKLPCQSFLRKKDGEILKLSTIGGVKVGQDCYYLPVDEVINVIKDYPVEVSEDEEIRKELLLDIPKVFPHDKAFRYIAYLEKQGERKHQYKSRPRYVGEENLLGKKISNKKPTEWSKEVEAAISLLKDIAEEQEKDYCPHNANDLRKAALYLETCRSQSTLKPSDEHYELEEFARVVRGNLTGISKTVQKLFEAKYLQLTGRKMYIGFKD